MSAFEFTPTRRIAVAILAVGYILSSHYLTTGGLLWQILAICLGLVLTTLLIVSLTSSSVGASAGGLVPGLMEGKALDTNSGKQPLIVGVNVPGSL